jgi:two-component system phosphate regulon sensor histidine kinase PhoR
MDLDKKTKKPKKKFKKKDVILSSRMLLEEMISSMREGVIVVENDLKIFASNPVARSFFGHENSDIETHSLDEIIHDKMVKESFRRAIEKGERTEVKLEINLRNDSRVYDLRVAPLSFAEKKEQKSAMGIFYDITRLERLEKVRQEFLSNVSHELRTPLTSILAFVETLVDGALDDQENNQRFLEVIRRNAERMHHLIDDILELSAIEAGKVTVRAKKLRLFPLVEEVFTSLASKANNKNIKFTNVVKKDTLVTADGRRLEQIISNLVSNAIKFNRENGEIIISYSKTEQFHQIQVKDTGEGIATEHLPRIFERFYRTDSARSRELGGTGLGLAIVKHLARLHGGEARVTSKLGHGSIFTIELPI